MASPAESVATFLVTKGVGVLAPTAPTSTACRISLSRLLDTPDLMIALYDTGGFTPNTKWQLDFVTVQAVIRGASDGYSAAYQKALDVKDCLLGVEAQAVGSGANQLWWSGITMLSDIAFLGYDDNSRPTLSANFRILLERDKSVLSNRDPLNYTGP